MSPKILTKHISLICLLLISYCCFSQSLYVAPTGAGDLYSKDQPGSLSNLSLKIEQLDKKTNATIEVVLLDGLYTLKAPLVFTPDLYSTPHQSIIFRAEHAGAAHISGGKLLQDWELLNYRKNIWRAPLGLIQSCQALFVEGQPAIKARFPNQEEDNNNFGPFLCLLNQDINQDYYQVLSKDVPSCKDWTKAKMTVISDPEKQYNSIANVRHSGDTSFIYTAAKDHVLANPFDQEVFYLEDDFFWLDSPGEWWVDEVGAMVFYIPNNSQNIKKMSIFAPQLDYLIKIEGTAEQTIQNITFEGISFLHTNPLPSKELEIFAAKGISFPSKVESSQAFSKISTAISVAYAKDIQFINNQFKALGGNGLILKEAVEGCKIINNTFHQIGAHAIVISNNQTKQKRVSSDIEIANNKIHKIARRYTHAAAIKIPNVHNLLIEHNEIWDCPYSAIQLGHPTMDNQVIPVANADIRYNHIHHVLQAHDNGGGIQTFGIQDQTKIYENHIHDFQRTPWSNYYTLAGVYLDSKSESIEVYRNVITNTEKKIDEAITKAAKNNTLKHNNQLDKNIQAFANINIAPPSKVQLVSGKQYTINQSLLKWKSHQADAKAFVISRKNPIGVFEILDTIDHFQNTYIDHSIPFNTDTLHYQIYSFNRNGNGPTSETITIPMIQKVSPLELEGVCSAFPWYERRWEVQNPNPFWVQTNWVFRFTDYGDTISIPPGNSYIFTGNVVGRRMIDIFWQNENGDTISTQSATTALTCDSYSPAAPSTIEIIEMANDFIELKWQHEGGDVDSIKIERKEQEKAFEEIAVLNKKQRSYLDKGLITSTQYTYRLRAYSKINSHSLYSELLEVRNPEANWSIRNVALNKTSNASSSLSDQTATNANDGDINSHWTSVGKRSEDSQPWWEVDLGKSFNIRTIELIPTRKEHQKSTRSNFEIIASNKKDFSYYVVLATQDATPFEGDFWKKRVKHPAGFRYIRIRRPAEYGQMNFAEIRIFSLVE